MIISSVVPRPMSTIGPDHSTSTMVNVLCVYPPHLINPVHSALVYAQYINYSDNVLWLWVYIYGNVFGSVLVFWFRTSTKSRPTKIMIIMINKNVFNRHKTSGMCEIKNK